MFSVKLSAVILNVHYFIIIIIHVLANKQAFCIGNVFVLTTLKIFTTKASISRARIG